MVRIRYLSDLHLEFIKPRKLEKFINRIPPAPNDICVLAGDIGKPYESNYDIFMDYISKNFAKSFVISGNHEYYNEKKTFEQTNSFLKEYFKKFSNISFLDNSYEIYNGYCFIGTTLWSKIYNPVYKINDVYNIPNFDCVKYNELNANCVNFLSKALEDNSNCVVITHHMPSESLIDKKYRTVNMKPYHQWFYCDLDNLIDDLVEKDKTKIKCWIYGHTHTPSNVKINGIPFLCNPIGYPKENDNINFETEIDI